MVETCNYNKGSLANSADPDEMLHSLDFGPYFTEQLHRLARICKFLMYEQLEILYMLYGPHCMKNLYSGVCEQQRHRPACAFAQTDQRLCYSLCGKYNI